MKFAHCIGLALLCVSAAFSQEEGSLLVDRGLPRANWNDASGVAARSNVRWTLYSQGFVGDDFTIGQPGERFVVNTLRMWAVPGAYQADPNTLGDVYQDIRLYLGGVFDYWFGSSRDQAFGGFTQSVKSSGWNFFGAAGYDFGLMPALVIRPFAGIGVLHGSAEVCTNGPVGAPFSGCSTASATDAAGLFGGQLMYLVSSSVHLGGEIRIIVASDAAVVLAGNVGMIF